MANGWVLYLRSEGRQQTAGMPRKLRLEFPGAHYHVINRGKRACGCGG